MNIGFHTFPGGKQYVFIKNNVTDKPCFLRNILFLSPPTDPTTIAIVREFGASSDRGTWEPPKGQMEWKEFATAGIKTGPITNAQLTHFQRDGVLREMVEEAKILPTEIKNLTKLPFVHTQDWDDSKQFMYQYWHATCPKEIMSEAQKRMATLVANPDWKDILPADMTEKDKIQWWNPERDGWGHIRGAFSKKMTQHYFKMLE